MGDVCAICCGRLVRLPLDPFKEERTLAVRSAEMQVPAVGMLTSAVSHRAGGIFVALGHLAEALAAVGSCQIRVFGLSDQHTTEDISKWAIPTKTFGVRGPRPFGFAPGLLRAVRSSDITILHSHGLWTYPSIVSLRWSRPARPYIISPHGMLDPWALNNSRWKKRVAAALYEDRHLQGASCLHALNSFEAQDFRKYGLQNPICIIPNGVTVPPPRTNRTPLAISEHAIERSRVLLYMGRLHPKKGLSELVHAWYSLRKEAKANGWRLDIAGWGDDNYESELQSLLKKLAVEDSVRLIGPRIGDAKADCFSRANAFILPSRSEGLPMGILEAWSYALPVLMTPQCNLADGFNVGAALQIGTEPEAMTSGLRHLFAMSESELRSIGMQGRLLVESNYNWRIVARRMIRVYQWLLNIGPLPEDVVSYG